MLGTDRLALALFGHATSNGFAEAFGRGADHSKVCLRSGAREQPMGWWIIVSGLIFILAAILACGSILPTSELVRAALDVIAILSGMVCVGLGEGV